MGNNPVVSVTTAESERGGGQGMRKVWDGVGWCRDLGFYSEQWEAVSDSEQQQTRLGILSDRA